MPLLPAGYCVEKSPRKPSSPGARKPAPAKPSHFPPANVAVGWTAAQLLAHGDDFEHYHFLNGEFGEARLAGLRFADCLFEHCNLTAASLAGTGLHNVAFAGCKLLGVPFAACRDMLFAVHFDHCQLGYASFAGKNLAGTRFAHCTLPETDFTNADLRAAVFEHCTLPNAIFHHTALAGADFTSATAYALDPEANDLTGTRFALVGLPGLLGKYGLVVE